MGDTPVWKKSEILNQLGGDEAFLKELIGDLSVLIAETRELLQKALDSGDLHQASALSHTLKGSSGNLGAQEIYTLSRDLELECKTGGSRVSELHENLKAALDRFLQEVRSQGYL